jgi:hypothetical protein
VPACFPSSECDPEGSIIGAMKVQTQTNLIQRGSAYVFRKKVPVDLRNHYCKESIRKSLGVPAVSTVQEEAPLRGELAFRAYQIPAHIFVEEFHYKYSI